MSRSYLAGIPPVVLAIGGGLSSIIFGIVLLTVAFSPANSVDGSMAALMSIAMIVNAHTFFMGWRLSDRIDRGDFTSNRIWFILGLVTIIMSQLLLTVIAWPMPNDGPAMVHFVNVGLAFAAAMALGMCASAQID